MHTMNRPVALASVTALLCLIGATPSFGQVRDLEPSKKLERAKGDLTSSEADLRKQRLDLARDDRSPDRKVNAPDARIPKPDDDLRLRRVADKDLTKDPFDGGRNDSAATDLHRLRTERAKAQRDDAHDPFGGAPKPKTNLALERISITKQAHRIIAQNRQQATALEKKAEKFLRDAARIRDHANMLEQKLQSHLENLSHLEKLSK